MSNRVKVLLILGILLVFVGLGGGLAMTLMGMVRTFNHVQAAETAKPDELAVGIKTSLMALAVGVPFGLVGLVLVVVGIVLGVCERRQAPKPLAPEQPLP